MEKDSMKKLLIATAALCTALPFTFDGVTPTVSKAHAIIGRPLTPMSVAGVHRRAMRRTYGVGANPAITPLLVQLPTARPLPEPVTMAHATAVGAAMVMGPATATRLTAMATGLVTATRVMAMATGLVTATQVMAMAMAGVLSAAVFMAQPLRVIGAKAD